MCIDISYNSILSSIISKKNGVVFWLPKTFLYKNKERGRLPACILCLGVVRADPSQKYYKDQFRRTFCAVDGGKVNNNKYSVSFSNTDPAGGIKDRLCVFWSAPIGELMRQQGSLWLFLTPVRSRPTIWFW